MKSWILLPFVLVAGLVIGAWGPRSEMLKTREEMKELRASLDKSRERASNFENMVRILRIPQSAPSEPAAEPDPETPAAEPAPAGEEAGPGAVAADTNAPPRRARRPMKEEIDEAIELWKVRQDLARNNFLSNARLGPAEAAQFDTLMTAMNVRLGERIETWAEALKQGDEVNWPETGARMINDLTGVFVLTYDEMDRTLPAWRGGGENTFDLVDFVDPAVAMPLVEVEDKLETAPRRRRFPRP